MAYLLEYLYLPTHMYSAHAPLTHDHNLPQGPST